MLLSEHFVGIFWGDRSLKVCRLVVRHAILTLLFKSSSLDFEEFMERLILFVMFGVWLWGSLREKLLWSVLRLRYRPHITLFGLHLSHLCRAVLKIRSEACAFLCQIFQELHGYTWTLRNFHLSESTLLKLVGMLVVRKLHDVELRPRWLLCLSDCSLGVRLEVETSSLLSLWLLLRSCAGVVLFLEYHALGF